MSDQAAESEFAQRLQRLDALVMQASEFTDPTVRNHTREIVQLLLELHGRPLQRLLDHVREAGPMGSVILDACASDGLVSGLLLLHGLHPKSLQERVEEAVEQVRSQLHDDEGSVELIEVSETVIRLRVQGGDDGGEALEQALDDAITARAPDVATIEIERVAGRVKKRIALPMLS